MIAEIATAGHVRAAAGLLLGLILGFVARRDRFCTHGAIEDAVYARDLRRARRWMLAAAVAILGVSLLQTYAGLDLAHSIYVGPRLDWGALVVGGLMFGFGMALVGTCGFGALLRLGGGDLRAFPVLLVLGLSSYMAISGIIAPSRVALTKLLSLDLGPTASQRLGAVLDLHGRAEAFLAYGLSSCLAVAALASPRFRQTPRLAYGAVVVGGVIVAGWWVNGVLTFDAFDTRTVGAFSFVRPVGETLLYAMLASGIDFDFGAASVLGVLVGAFVAALAGREFRWEAPDDARELRRHIVGAFLMGTGGVTALGCTIGQGLSGLSTLSVGSMLALAAILCGARGGLFYLVERKS